MLLLIVIITSTCYYYFYLLLLLLLVIIATVCYYYYQFYHIAVDNEYPYNVYGGMQDNGSWRGPAYVWRSQGIRNSYWQEISFGDGFDVVPDRDDSRYGWSMSQQGYVSRYDWQTGIKR